MPGSTNKRKRNAPSDFKRVKAKVGKRAPKPANVTDTSFRSSSLSVRSQAVDLSSGDGKLLVSARGRSVHELTTQLHHPAAAVRTSAIRGLGSAVDSHSEFLKAHLSILLPAVAKCCVDEEDGVRQLGLSVLRDILTRTCEENVMRPFIALLTAYVTSALNSLDRSTRLDGGRAVEILSTALPSLMASRVETMLPAFVGLLSDHSLYSRRSETPKKRKTTGGSDEGGRYAILRALVALLRTIPAKQVAVWDSSSSAESTRPDLTFVPGGRTVNALLITGQQRRSVHPIQSINELVAFMEGDLVSVNGDRLEKKNFSVAIATELISKLRGIIVEVSQRGDTEGIKGNSSFLTATDADELSLLVKAVRLFWNAFCRDMIHKASDSKARVVGLRQVYMRLLSLLLELFPVRQQNPSDDVAMKYALLNADLCATLMDIGGCLATEAKALDWTKKILEYLLPRLENSTLAPTEVETCDGTSSTVVDVIARLLLLRHDSLEFTLPDKTRRMVLERLSETFFLDDDLNPHVARSASSRKAVLLIVAMLRHENFVSNTDVSPFTTSLQMAVKRLPFYLEAWRSDFIPESRVVLSALHDVSRHLDLECPSTQDILQSLRNGLIVVFAAPKRMKRQKGDPPSHSPIFEEYPEEMQRLALGLLVMLQSPNDTTTNGLSYMCARSGWCKGALSAAIADAVLNAVHSIRRSMSMQAYLRFVISCIGITSIPAKRKEKRDLGPGTSSNVKGDPLAESETRAGCEAGHPTSLEARSSEVQIDVEFVKAKEALVLRAARSLILCGSAKVLPMINPVLKDWLAGVCHSSGFSPTQMAHRFRAASAITAILILDILSSFVAAGDEDKSHPSIFDVAPDLGHNLLVATCYTFVLCFSRSGPEYDSLGAFDCLMQPVLVSEILFVFHAVLMAILIDRSAHSRSSSA